LAVRPPDVSLAASASQGLSADEAKRRLAQYGPNEVETGGRLWALRALLGFLLNPLVLILLVASLVSAALGEVTDATLITLMIVLSIGLDFAQVFRSQQAASRLQQLVAATSRVWRDGLLVEIPVRELVPGDDIEMRAGDLIPADATLQSGALSVDEAALTGESLPVERRVGDPLFAGTSVVSGVGQGSVTATGRTTQFGAIARSLLERAPPSEFERGIQHFGMLILRTVIGLVLFVLFVNAILRRDPFESFLFALALAVGLTPEFLPMIITVTLTQGALRMAPGHVIVKRLAAIENLGSMDVICSDKTGTLTQGKIVLEEHLDVYGKDSAAVLQWGCVNSALETGVRSPLDLAILAHDHPAIPDFTKIAELPLDFDRRRVSVAARGPGGSQLVVKGAPEGIIPLCSQVEVADRVEPFDSDIQSQANETFDRLSRGGYHVLAIARKPLPDGQMTLTTADERDLIFAGFAAFMDPADPSAAATVAELRDSGVAIKILTGDNDLVARAICSQVGIAPSRLVLGDELAKMTDDALASVAEQTDIFARVTPSQKNRIIRALKRNGHVVGYVGDGINDAPSLHAADVGISVSNGVDVAKGAADVILLERSLAAIHRGVVEGRRSFGNITKYVLMGTSSNFGNTLSMAAASAVLPFLPLLPSQILLNNFLYDLAQVTIPTDNVDSSYLMRPRKWDTGLVQRFMLTLGPVSSLFDFATFALLLGFFQATPEQFRAGWFIESLATQTLVIFVIRTAGNPVRSRPSKPLTLSVIGAILAATAAVWSPVGSILGFAPPPTGFVVLLPFLVLGYMGAVELIKRPVYRASGWRPDPIPATTVSLPSPDGQADL
jgi:Mg2+-importing ATPase